MSVTVDSSRRRSIDRDRHRNDRYPYCVYCITVRAPVRSHDRGRPLGVLVPYKDFRKLHNHRPEYQALLDIPRVSCRRVLTDVVGGLPANSCDTAHALWWLSLPGGRDSAAASGVLSLRPSLGDSCDNIPHDIPGIASNNCYLFVSCENRPTASVHCTGHDIVSSKEEK